MASIQPSLRDFGNTEFLPALKRRAIFICASGAENQASIFKHQSVSQSRLRFFNHTNTVCPKPQRSD
jgi:hypothetical protein